ncbi:MAG TPA: DUF748 domain-containing protein [Planctomycetota bacterium]|nr:DUF748 domain-containing protein [Planctomycetota bacterium]
MSDAREAPAASTTPPPATAASSSRPTSRWRPTRRGLRRWARRLAVALVALILVRWVLALAIPGLVGRVARGYGFQVHWDRLDFSILEGELELARVVVTPLGGKPSIATIGYVRLDIEPLSLLAKELHVRRAEADGVSLIVERDRDGELEIVKAIERARGERETKGPRESLQARLQKLVRTSFGVVIEALRVEHLEARIRDASVTPNLDAHLAADLRVTDLAFNAPLLRPASLDLDVTCPPVLERLHAHGDWKAVGAEVTSTFEVALDRLHTRPLAGYLAPLGLRPASEELSGGARLEGFLYPSLEKPGARALTVTLDASRLAADGGEVFSLPRVLLEAPVLAPDHVAIARLEVSGLRTRARRAEDGSLEALGLRFEPRERPDRGEEVARADENGASADLLEAETIVDLRELSLRDFRASLRDDALPGTTPVELELDHVVVRGVERDPGAPDAAATVDARFRAKGVVETIAIVGTAVPFAHRRRLELTLAADGAAPRAIGPELEELGLRSLLESGSCRLTLRAWADRLPDGSYLGEGELSSISYRDGAELAGLDRALVKGVHFQPDALRCDVALLEVAGPRVRLGRDSSGALVAGGIRISPEAWRSKKPARRRAPLRSGRIGVERVQVHDVRVIFDDESTRAPAHLAVADGGLEIRSLICDADPAAPTPDPAPMRAWLALPGLAENVAVLGSIVASPTSPRVALVATLDEITLRAAAPYLEAAGIRNDLEHGRLSLALHADAKLEPPGTLEANAALDRLSFHDRRASGDRELLAIDGAAVSGLHVTGTPVEHIRLERVTLGGLHTEAALEENGVVSALDLALAPRRGDTAAVASAREVPAERGLPPWPATPSEAPPPFVELGALEVRDVVIGLHDRSHPEHVDAELRGGFECGPIAVDLASRSAEAPGHVAAWASVPGVIERLTFDGVVAASGSGGNVRARVEASGLQGGPLTARLAALGVEPLLHAGRFGFDVSADARRTDYGISGDAALGSFALEDGGEELCGVDSVRMSGIEVAPGHLKVGAVAVVRPRARARRDGEDTLVALGLRIRRARPASPSLLPDSGTTPHLADPGPGRKPSSQPSGPPMPIELGALSVEHFAAAIEDDTVTPPLLVEPTGDLAIDGVVLGREAPPARIALGVTAPGAGSLRLSGTVSPGPEKQAAALDLDLTELDGRKIDPYLGDRGRVTLREGRLHARIEAGLAPADGGGKKGQLTISDLLYRDGDEGEPLLRLDALRLRASRIDPAAGRIALDEVSALGLQTDVERTASGEARLLGVVMAPPPRAAEEAAVTTTTAAAEDIARLSSRTTAAERRRLGKTPPLVEVNALVIAVDRLGVVDRARAGAAPITVSRFVARSLAPIALLGSDPASHPPIELELLSEVAPVASSIALRFRLAPFAVEPELTVDLAIDGLRGAGLTQVVPELAATLDGAPLRDGRIRGSLTVNLKTGRHDPLDFDLTRGFGADVLLRGLELRDGDLGPTLAGLDELHADVVTVLPTTGDLHIRTLEVDKPVGLIDQERDGLHVGGMTLKERAEPPAPPPPSKDDLVAPGLPGKAEAAAAKVARKEVRIDRIVISGMQGLYSDRTCQPSVLVPLTGLDVEVLGFTTRAFSERRTIRFDARVRGGELQLPLSPTRPVPARRAIFEELGINGDLTLSPLPVGRIRTSLSGFELDGVAGKARAEGLEVKDGVVDIESEVLLTDRGQLRSKNEILLNSLSAKELENGPARKALDLPVPLDAAIAALRDSEGTIELALPLDLDDWVHLTRTELRSQLTSTAAHAIGVIILNATKSAPIKAVGAGTAPRAREEPPLTLAFASADTALSDSAARGIAVIAGRLRDEPGLVLTLRHELGGGDLARARITANPSPTDRHDLIARLRKQRDELSRRREDEVAETRALLAAGRGADAERTRRRVQATDSELASIDRGLDELYELSRAGAERKAERRARQACAELADARLAAVRAALVASGIADHRVHLARPRVTETTGDGGGVVTATLKLTKGP